MEPNVIKLLNPKIQKSRQIRLVLPKAWRLTGAVRSMTLAIGIPGDYRDHDVWGDVSEIENHGPVVVRRVEFESDDEPVEVRFVYENLKMFCQACGSLKHHKAQCPFPRANWLLCSKIKLTSSVLGVRVVFVKISVSRTVLNYFIALGKIWNMDSFYKTFLHSIALIVINSLTSIVPTHFYDMKQ